MKRRRRTEIILVVATLAAPLGCTTGDDRAGPPPGAAERAPQAPPTTASGPLETVETLEDRLRLLDDDGDGFVDREEAEAFYRWRFDKLDDDGDGRLSRAELQVEFPDVPDAETAVEELVGVSEDQYTRAELERFGGRAETSGMMSTADFHDMVRAPGALKREWPP